VAACATQLPEGPREEASSCEWDEAEWKETLRERQRIRTWRFEPPVTAVGDPDRHVWEGVLGDLMVGEFATGTGCFLAAAIQSGWTARWMVEPEHGSQALAKANCPTCPLVMDSIFDVDPSDLPWVHLLLGGACCQPFSKAGGKGGWGDDRAYSTIRFLHNVTVMQPFLAVCENVQPMLSVHGGRVWEVIKGTLEAVGYEVQALRVCPTR
jgi:hypothetical protein